MGFPGRRAREPGVWGRFPVGLGEPEACSNFAVPWLVLLRLSLSALWERGQGSSVGPLCAHPSQTLGRALVVLCAPSSNSHPISSSGGAFTGSGSWGGSKNGNASRVSGTRRRWGGGGRSSVCGSGSPEEYLLCLGGQRKGVEGPLPWGSPRESPGPIWTKSGDRAGRQGAGLVPLTRTSTEAVPYRWGN